MAIHRASHAPRRTRPFAQIWNGRLIRAEISAENGSEPARQGLRTLRTVRIAQTGLCRLRVEDIVGVGPLTLMSVLSLYPPHRLRATPPRVILLETSASWQAHQLHWRGDATLKAESEARERSAHGGRMGYISRARS
jgi:hypothetical protein